MAVADWELNLFHSDPTLLERSNETVYERSAHALATLADPEHLKLLHALAVGEDTALRAAAWAGVGQAFAERQLAAMALAGVLVRRDTAEGSAYAPADGHFVVQLYTALAHGGETRPSQPRLLAHRRRSSARRAIEAG